MSSVVQAALLVAAGAPAITSGTSSAPTAGRSSASAASAPSSLAATRPGTNPAKAVRGTTPPRGGLVAGTPQASWIPNGQVNALATDGTYVYLAGTFTQLLNPATGLSQAHVGLGRIRLSTGIADAAWNPAVDGTPEALAYNPASSTLYVGGLFTTVTGANRTNLAAVSTTSGATLSGFTPDPTNPTTPAKGDVRALLIDQGALVVGGSFTQIAGANQKNLAKVDPATGALDNGFTPAVNAGVFAVNRPPGSTVYAIGGAFTMLGGNPHSYLGLVNRSTGAASAWIPAGLCPAAAICPVLSISSNVSQLFVAAGGPGGQALRYDLATGARGWKIVADGNTQAIVVLGTEVYVGGHFDPTFGTAQRKTLAAVDAATGQIDPTFRPSAKSTFPGTEALLTVNGSLVAAGAQLNIGGTAQSRFAIFPGTTPPARNAARHPATRLDHSAVHH